MEENKKTPSQKKLLIAIAVLLVVLVAGLILVIVLLQKQANSQNTQAQVQINAEDGLKKGLVTACDAYKVFNAKVDSLEEAKQAITDYGQMQRELYDNDKVKKLEQKLESKYGILAVNLGEMDYATAKDIQKACDYMFKQYPQLRDTLTNISITNFPEDKPSAIAITETREFIINEDYAATPFVVRYQIILNASKFLKRDRLLATCQEMVEAGHWPEGTNITSLIVHELGHQVLDTISMKKHGLKGDKKYDCVYVTDDNIDGYSYYITDSLSANQAVPQEVLEEAYLLWKDKYGGNGSEEDFRVSISEYAGGVQEDGGISYPETVAEAVADVYLNKKKASDASKAIVEVLKKRIAE